VAKGGREATFGLRVEPTAAQYSKGARGEWGAETPGACAGRFERHGVNGSQRKYRPHAARDLRGIHFQPVAGEGGGLAWAGPQVVDKRGKIFHHRARIREFSLAGALQVRDRPPPCCGGPDGGGICWPAWLIGVSLFGAAGPLQTFAKAAGSKRGFGRFFKKKPLSRLGRGGIFFPFRARLAPRPPWQGKTGGVRALARRAHEVSQRHLDFQKKTISSAKSRP